jgi:hypothetical protein
MTQAFHKRINCEVGKFQVLQSEMQSVVPCEYNMALKRWLQSKDIAQKLIL